MTNDIERAYVLKAVWQQVTDVYVNVTLKHNCAEGDHLDKDAVKYNVDFTVDGRQAGTYGDYTEIIDKHMVWDGSSEFADACHTATTDGETTVYTATAPSVFGVPADWEYTFTTNKTGYAVESVETTTDAEGNVVINAVLRYQPKDFDFVYTVELDEEAKALPAELKPTAANVKVTRWYDSEVIREAITDWYPIERHVETYEKITLDADGKGTGSFPVLYKSNDGSTTYYYRIEVVSYVLPDGTVMAAENVGGAHEVFATADNRYSAKVSVTGGKDPADGDASTLTGAWSDGTAQYGEVKAVVSIEVFDVILDPNGGQLPDGTTAAKELKYQLTVPQLEDYTPTREGGYTFLGWYLADASGNATAETVTSGDELHSDITLIAKWAEPLTVEGTVSLAETYELNGTTIVIPEADRAHSAMVLLKKLDANGYDVTVQSAMVHTTCNDSVSVGTYSFTGIPDDGSKYIISVKSPNYTETYQNELSASTEVTDYASYDADHNAAEFAGDKTAVVNVYLAFTPALFDLQYTVDATAIAEGFRPTAASTLVLCDDGTKGNNPQNWTVITQMTGTGTAVGQQTVLTGGVGTNSVPVWESKADGTTLYDYAIRVDGYSAGAVNRVFDAQTAPFMIYYNGSARFSALHGQTQMLTATMVPKMYTVTFDLNADTEAVDNMETYLVESGDYAGQYQDTYYWSYGKAITAMPTRAGYVFMGWLDEGGNKVTAIPADYAKNVTLTAQWEQLPATYTSDYAYIFGYNDTTMGAEGLLLRCEISAMIHRLVKQNGQLGGFVYNEADTPDFTDIAGEWFRSGVEYMNYKGSFPAGEKVYPYAQITRGEAFKHICIGLGFTEKTDMTVDEYADLLYRAGLIVGDGSGNLNVGGMITRAEFCTMYNRIIGRQDAVLTTADGTAITAQTYGFTDLLAEKWYHDNMLRATSAYNAGYVSIEMRGIRNVLDDYGG